MNFITRLRIRFRRWRRKRTSRKQKAPLREFVYLDEVSVYSLYASRLGSIAEEFIETQTASLQGEIGSSVGANSGIVKAEVKPSVSSDRTHESQVIRKSIVQTTFKEFYESELDSLAMRPVSEDPELPKIGSLEHLKAEIKTLETDGWVVNPAKLTRGQLLEAEVQLEAEAIFRVNAVVSAVQEIVQDEPEMSGLDRNQELNQVSSVNRILEKLLAGLVPIRGYATDYEVVEIEGREWIVHSRLLNQLASTNSLRTYPLYVVGVAEQSLFWKDIRRVLFSGARFRVLCRMTQDGLQNSWTPVKLAHVLRSVEPGLADQIDALGSGALAAMVETGKPDGSTERKQQLMHEALIAYARSMVDHYGHSLTAQDLSEIELLSEQHCTSSDTLTGRREAFDEITSFLHERFDFPWENLIAAQYRSVALTDAGFPLLKQATSPVASDDVPSPASSQERFLDSEFIAIYW